MTDPLHRSALDDGMEAVGWKIRNPELDWFLGGPRFELWNLKDKTPKKLRPNRGGTSLFLPRQKNWWCHMDSWLVSGSSWLVR